MPRVCTVCTNPQREAIDKALIAGESIPSISARYSTLGRMALTRHRENHLPAALVQAEAAKEVARGDTLLDQVKSLQADALEILAAAKEAKDLRTAVSAIRASCDVLELLGKVTKELNESPPVIAVISVERWQAARVILVQALAPYPDAALAVAEALHAARL